MAKQKLNKNEHYMAIHTLPPVDECEKIINEMNELAKKPRARPTTTARPAAKAISPAEQRQRDALRKKLNSCESSKDLVNRMKKKLYKYYEQEK